MKYDEAVKEMAKLATELGKDTFTVSFVRNYTKDGVADGPPSIFVHLGGLCELAPTYEQAIAAMRARLMLNIDQEGQEPNETETATQEIF